MPIWSDSFLQDLRDRAEIELSTEVPCIFKRFSLTVTQGVAQYELPEEVITIRRITWKGKKVFPTTHQEQDASFNQLEYNSSRTGTPDLYIQLKYGRNQLVFYPTPSESITADDTDLDTIEGIQRRVVISAYVPSDLNSYRIPEYMRRRLVKQYVNYKAYLKEDQGMRVSAAEYFRQKWERAKEQLRTAKGGLYRGTIHQMGSIALTRKVPARPSLPSNFGRKVYL